MPIDDMASAKLSLISQTSVVFFSSVLEQAIITEGTGK